MKARPANIIVAASAFLLSVASFFVVMQGATDEPYTAFRQSDALVQIGIAMVLMLLWIQLAAAIVVGVARRRLSSWWLSLLLWVLICQFYLFHSPIDYIWDISQYVAQSQ